MPRNIYYTEPEVINSVITTEGEAKEFPYLEIATSNRNKLEEFQRILTGFKLVAKDISLPEIQSLDPLIVAVEKAKEAYKQNHYNPILVEDVSLEIAELGGRPGPYVKDFCSDRSMRERISSDWLTGRKRDAVAKTIIAIYDGKEVHTWEGKIIGSISSELRGQNGFGWDDFFIPKGSNKTFAEMTNLQKDKYSMRAMAAKEMIKNFPKLSYPILKLPEPYDQELRRVNVANLQDRKAMKFAFSLECIETKNKPNGEFVATNYSPIYTTSNSYFTRFLHQEDTSSLGLILTDVDRKRLKFYQNGDPVLWQMGPERRHLALVQRAEYFKTSQSKEVHKLLDDLEKSKDAFPSRTNHRSAAVEELLGIEASKITTKAASLQELGYKKLDSNKYTSRTSSAKSGLFNIVGKHPRSIYGVGSLPAVSGWRDVIVTSAIGHILTFVHRNSMNAVDAENQIKLIQSAQKVIKNLKLNDKVTIGHLII